MLEAVLTLIFSSLIAFGYYFYKRDSNESENQTSVIETYRALAEELEMLESEIRSLIPAEDAVEIVSLLDEYDNIRKLERSKLNIANLEVTSLENRLREFTDIEQELESSSIETREIAKGFRATFEEVKQKVDSLRQTLPIFEESVNKLGLESAPEVSGINESLNKYDEFFDSAEKSIDVICNLKSRFDALDIEFAELFEKFGELEV